MKEILVIDNYDSFTYNLVHHLEALGARVHVVRNDQITLEEIAPYNHIVLSPGPGIPDEAGLLKAIIQQYAPTKAILGVCLGQQAIAEVFGGSLTNLSQVYHGIGTPIDIDSSEPMFQGLPHQINVGRYHSWVVNQSDLPAALRVTARDLNGQIMAIRHREYEVCAVQFHPESILTPDGAHMLSQWLKHTKYF
ncbi:MAG: hypothetical protein RLZZ593_247 [Bacteroidota bacterium]|jgi:anthranilate synthase component 2